MAATLALALAVSASAAAAPPTTDTLSLRGHRLVVHLYGTRGAGDPVIVSSGDGGWMHLGPHVAEFLESKGFFVVGFDAKAYLESFTTNTATLSQDDVVADFHVLIDYAAKGSVKRPLLAGVSEGAGLSVLAATDAALKSTIAGVIALGLPDLNELGWRWKDAVIYITHTAPKEPTFSSASVIARVAPLPLAAIHSTNDEFVPLTEIQRIVGQAAEPKKLWIVRAANHRFSDNLSDFNRSLSDAIDWVRQHQIG